MLMSNKLYKCTLRSWRLSARAVKTSCVLIGGLLAGCIAEPDYTSLPNPLSLTMSANRQISALDLSAVEVTVSINNGTPRVAQQAGNGIWRLSGLKRNDYQSNNNDILIAWTERVDGTPLLLAEYTGKFSIGDDAFVTPVGEYITAGEPRFDVNGDGTSNLAERSSGSGTALVPEMVSVPAGCFDMGSPPLAPERNPDEGPQFNACINALSIGKYEVTNDEYNEFIRATGRGELRRSDRQPVANVTLIDAFEYTQWLSAETGENYRLPTEAEWEYAARGSTITPFNTGELLTVDQANIDGRFTYNGSPVGIYRAASVTVGQFPANAFGLYDTHGNVREWTCSAYKDPYDTSEQRCDLESDLPHSIRGGSWFLGPQAARSALRNFDEPDYYSSYTGFRIAKN